MDEEKQGNKFQNTNPNDNLTLADGTKVEAIDKGGVYRVNEKFEIRLDGAKATVKPIIG